MKTMRAYTKNWQLYLFIIPTFSYFILFHYWPLYGLQIAFKDFNVTKGIWGSSWVGLEHFQRFFNSFQFNQVIKNTVLTNLYQLAMFPIPIIVALSMNELMKARFKKFVQTVTYAPHFISTVVMSGMILLFLDPTSGLLNHLIQGLGFKPIAFIAEPAWFKTIFVLSGEWQNFGWSAIIYLAALTGVNPDLHEAATIDGATRLQRIIHINIPGILPTITILFILKMGSFMNVGFEKVFLLQNSLNLEASEVIQTYVYKVGLLNAQYSFSTAVGLFNSVVNCALLIFVNLVTKRLRLQSLW